MKVTENKPHSVHLRLNNAQWDFCKGNADLMGVGVSEFIRMMVNSMVVTSEKAKAAALATAATLGNLGSSHEDEAHD